MKALKVVLTSAAVLSSANALAAGPLAQVLPLGRITAAVPVLGVASGLGSATPLPRAAAALSGGNALGSFGKASTFSSTPLPGLESRSPAKAGCEPLCGGGGGAGGILGTGYMLNPNYIPKLNYWAQTTIADTQYNVWWANYSVNFALTWSMCDGMCQPLANPVGYVGALSQNGPGVLLNLGNSLLGGVRGPTPPPAPVVPALPS